MMGDGSLMLALVGVFVAALGVLFTVGAIAAGFVLFRQSRDHRQLIEEFVQQYREILDGMRTQVGAQVEGTIAELRMKSETVEGEAKERLEKVIARLRATAGSSGDLLGQARRPTVWRGLPAAILRRSPRLRSTINANAASVIGPCSTDYFRRLRTQSSVLRVAIQIPNPHHA